MNTQTQPVQPVETQPQPVVPPSAPQGLKPNTANYILMVFGFVLLLVIASGAAYLFGSGKIGMLGLSPTPTPTITITPPVEITNTPMLTASPSVSLASSPSVSVSLTQKPKPTIIPNPDGNTFSSNKMGISFYYANKTPADSTGTVKVQESGSIVYVYISSGKPESGQSIERFPKSTTDTLSQAITKKFLTGIPTTDCSVNLDPKKPSPTVTKATISYPMDDPAQLNVTYGEKCPEHYSESNGMAYFFEDSKYPDRFYYVSIGQYTIPSGNSKPDSKWQDTIAVF